MFKKHKYGDKGGLLLVTCLIFVSSGLFAYMTYNIGRLVDFGLAKNLPAMDPLARLMIILGLAILAVELLGALAKTSWIQRSMNQLKKAYLDGLLELEVVQLQKDQIPQMYSNLTNDFDRYETKFIKNIPILIGMGASFTASLVLLATVNLFLMIVPVAVLLFFWWQSKNSSQPIKKEEKKKSQSLEAYTRFITETSQGYEVIKQHQLEVRREIEFTALAVKVQADNYQVDLETTKVEAKNALIINGVLFSLLIGGMLTALKTGVSFGNVVVVFSAFMQVMWPIQQLSLTLAEMRGIEDVIDSVGTNLTKVHYPRELRVDSFSNLDFAQAALGYADETILEKVSLNLSKNEKILIIGPSGAGKSTILKTIRQSIQARGGSVTLNGLDILSIKVQDYFSMFATVDQIGFIFSGTLRDNISLYQDVSSDRLGQIMAQVGLTKLSPDLEIHNDGGNLSGGQRARVLLARALCLEAEVIVCDEIFASLDSEVARSIEHDLLNIDATCINVSHIYFEENLHQYDRIYIVGDHTVRVAQSIDEIRQRMLEISPAVS
ncbi:MAG: ABC transporter ATP-binding protein [Clostridiaceae bacterium]